MVVDEYTHACGVHGMGSMWPCMAMPRGEEMGMKGGYAW